MGLPRLIFPGRRTAYIALAAAAIVFVVVGGSAQAKVSGSNGRIAFAREDPALGDTVTYTMNPDGSNIQPLLPPGFTSGLPRWSPDGSEVAVGSTLSLDCCPYSAVIINPDTGNFRTLAMQDPNVGTFCQIWSPDATRLACVGDSPDPSARGVYTIRSSDGGDLTRITNAGATGGVDVIDVPIDYSPDGKQIVFGHIVFSHASPGHACSALYVVNVSGSDPQRITPCRFVDDDGSWSPDGSKIVFEHLGSLFTVHPDGTGLVKIPLQTGSATTAFTAFDAAWSPDGTKLVFSLNTKTSSGGTQEGIGTANADGSNVQQVTVSPTRDHQADWGSHALITP
jgi:Tol biopolymer transport system component